MAKYRNGLPQLKGGTFITDGGMETTMIFQEGIDLPHFAAFILLASEEGRQRLRNYYRRYLDVARRHGTGFVLDTATWRANPDWGQKLGYTNEALKAVNEEAVDLLVGLRSDYERPEQPIVISGAIGPRGDGYKAGIMDAAEAEDYHAFQIGAFAGTEADMVSAFTLTNIDEAIGVARAAQALGMPSAISFTLETDGRLVTGRSLQEAIETTDAMTGGAPAYYMINCAHPTHFETALDPGSAWVKRISGIRANASTMSHEQLDNSETLDAGDPEDLGRRYRKLIDRMPALRVLGGCCGTDHRHVAAICEACLPQAA
ncbi:homocysteine S-methyltransferase family protein [Rhizobium leguminosarum bv. viciae 248]|uniref:homocysteine S-methyltransferase family protein n=1 Tax=Rhizobium leguminosarum TaxID=384 RepID=UPI00035E414D|nr:homocysteine S-methyltransferase family protein [Rhizobium leguminosarum]MCA2407621.1 homocysteine S-methyltransferase family protein [Rhizobium leguminosarum]NKM60096.1 homocysteine methyltransferase [Rhizobium leguminosarum bv. viciae]QHW23821.1 homocysteine S-methyltransferase family protein [Rhizobium leguminosarum bv. viciae 248]